MISSASTKAAMLGESTGVPGSGVPRAMSPRENGNSPDEMDEERLHAQREIQMLDLGTGRREYVTTIDKPQPLELRQTREKLLRGRKVNEEGTDAAKWYQENKKALNAWNNIGEKIADDHADKEQLADIMGGQSHRARLNKEIREQGGQEYSELTTHQINNPPHPRRRIGAGARGMLGRSGRGAPMHIPVARTDRKPIATAESSKAPVGPRANRLLDPAISPDRDCGYKSKRGGKTITMAYSGGPAVKVGPPQSRGNTLNEARAAMIGSTVRIGTKKSSKANSQHSGTSEASQAPRVPQQRVNQDLHFVPLLINRRAPVTVALNDQAFLQVLNNMRSKPDFNNHVQERSKPAPASKAASLFDKTAKPPKNKPAGTKSQSQPPLRSEKTLAEAFQELRIQAEDKVVERDRGKIRLVPTHEFGFPPPVTKPGGKRPIGSKVSEHTDGVESAATFESAEYSKQSSTGTQPKGNITIGKVLDGIRGGLEGKEDLLTLDHGTGDVQGGCSQPSKQGAPAPSITSSTASAAVPDIMDEDLDANLPHTPLTPGSMTAPHYITYRGSRYVRTDQIASPDVKHNHENTPRDGQPARVEVTPQGLNIGLQTLQQMSTTNSILGDHNLPLRKRNTESTDVSSNASLEASQWAGGRNPFLASGTPHATDILHPLQHATFTLNIQKSASSLSGGLPGDLGTQISRTGRMASSSQSTSKEAATLSSSKWAAPGAQTVTSDRTVKAVKEATQSISSKDGNAAAEVTAKAQVAERRKRNPFSTKTQSPGPRIREDSEESEI